MVVIRSDVIDEKQASFMRENINFQLDLQRFIIPYSYPFEYVYFYHYTSINSRATQETKSKKARILFNVNLQLFEKRFA